MADLLDYCFGGYLIVREVRSSRRICKKICGRLPYLCLWIKLMVAFLLLLTRYVHVHRSVVFSSSISITRTRRCPTSSSRSSPSWAAPLSPTSFRTISSSSHPQWLVSTTTISSSLHGRCCFLPRVGPELELQTYGTSYPRQSQTDANSWHRVT